MEEAVMHMSDIFVAAAFDWSESIRNDATNFPQYIYGWDLQGWRKLLSRLGCAHSENLHLQ